MSVCVCVCFCLYVITYTLWGVGGWWLNSTDTSPKWGPVGPVIHHPAKVMRKEPMQHWWGRQLNGTGDWAKWPLLLMAISVCVAVETKDGGQMHSRVFTFVTAWSSTLISTCLSKRTKNVAQNAIKGAPRCSIVALHWGYLSPAAALIGFQLPAPAS